MFTCEKCGTYVTEKRSLLRHMKTHLQSTEAHTCDVCGKDFDREDARNRHIKTHVDYSQTYSCGVCAKDFKRADIRNRHEAAHSYTITCPVCDRYFNRRESMLRHRTLHERPEAKQRLAMKRPATPEPRPSPKQRSIVLPPAKTLMESHVEPDVLPDDPDTRALNRQNWQSIRTEEATGNFIQDRYNFTLTDITSSTFPEMVRYLYRQQTTAFKINVSFCSILRNIEAGELKYYHPSQNNVRFFDAPYLIKYEEGLDKFLDDLSRHDILEFFRQQRPDTKWGVNLLTNMTFYVNTLIEHSLGASVVLPDFFLRNQGLVCSVDGSNGPYTDNLCFSDVWWYTVELQ